MRKRILVLTSTFPRWPGDREPPFVFELCRRLKQTFDVFILAPHGPGAKLIEIMDGITIRRYPYFIPQFEHLAYHGGILANLREKPLRHLLLPFFLSAQLFYVGIMLRRYSIDLIHAHWIFPQGFIAVIATMLCRKKISILCTSHGGDFYGLQGPLFKKLQKWVLGKTNAATVVSSAMKADLKAIGVKPEKISVIPMGVDLQKGFVPARKRTKSGCILFVGRLVPKKGVRHLVEAMPEVLRSCPETILKIAGEGQEKNSLVQLSEKLGIRSRVHFIGSVENKWLPALYQSADMAVFPFVVSKDGDREGLGLVVVEAMGCECPVVVSHLPAIDDIVPDSATAKLVPPGNVRALARAISRILNDRQQTKRMVESARISVLQKFDWEIIGDRYRKLMKLSMM